MKWQYEQVFFFYIQRQTTF